MKKIIIKVAAIILTLVLAASCFVGCAFKGETLMELEGIEISVNLYKLYLSILKGELCSSYGFGADALEDDFWDIVMSADGRTTYNKYYCDAVLDNTKTRLAALYEFEQCGLELPKETVAAIDAKMKKLLEDETDGSKTALNAILYDYGATYEVLRELYIIDAKIAMLKDSIYGNDGELIAKNLIDDYYSENYARFKQVFFATYDYVYETDENGDDIYFTSDGKIAYDTKATLKTDGNGNILKDKNGDSVYINKTSDGKESIAYDKENGKRQNKTDEDGSYIIDSVSDEKKKELEAAAQIMMDKTSNGDFATFDTLIGEDEAYPNGYYITKDIGNTAKEVIDEVFKMEVGEVKLVPSEYGVHLVMRYELEEDGYRKKDNSDFFIDTKTGNFVFMNDLENQLLTERVAHHKSRIIVDEKVLATADMKSIKPNFYYF